MKTMKKLVAALLVLTMVLALTGAAFAETVSNKLCVGDYAKFTKNAYAYDEAKSSKKVTGPEIIVRKGSIGRIIDKKGSFYRVQLTPAYGNKDFGNTEDIDGNWAWCFWFKSSTLGETKKTGIAVTFSNGGVGMSKPYFKVYKDTSELTLKWMQKNLLPEEFDEWLLMVDNIRLSDDCKKHVKATAKVWMHKNPSLSNSYGKALHKDDVVKYRRVWGFDSRRVVFYGIRYSGKCLWVSSAYSKIVK